MARPVRHALFVLCLLALVAGALPHAAAATEYGVHMDLTFMGYAGERAQSIARARDGLGATISRNSLLWDKVERTPGQRDWSLPDAVVGELGAAGLEPLFTIYGSPAWANGVAPGTPDSRSYVPQDDQAFDAWVESYAGFAREAARRYRGRVHRWEIGNESNEHFFWKPRPDARRYAQWYRALRAAILAEDPTAQVAVGGLAGLAAGGDIPGIRFLQQLAALGVHPEIVALHPYPSDEHAPDVHLQWKDNFDDIGMVHDYLERSGHPARIWVTEWGWSSARLGAERQAQYTAKSLEMIRDQFPYVEVATMFVEHDLPTYSQGLFRADGTAKPAAGAFARAVRAAGDRAPRVAKARARAGRRRLRVTASGADCRKCRGWVELRGRGRPRRLTMPISGSRGRLTVKAAAGRWRWRVVLQDGESGRLARSRVGVVRVR